MGRCKGFDSCGDVKGVTRGDVRGICVHDERGGKRHDHLGAKTHVREAESNKQAVHAQDVTIMQRGSCDRCMKNSEVTRRSSDAQVPARFSVNEAVKTSLEACHVTLQG